MDQFEGVPKFDIAPKVGGRVRGSKNFKDYLRSGKPEPYVHNTSGSYNDYFFINARGFENQGPCELKGTEFMIYRLLCDIEKKKQVDGDNSPLVVVDFGGGDGMSMVKLAAAFREKVKEKKAFFIVSNLAYQPDKAISRMTSFRPSEERFITDNQELVNYGRTDARELIQQSVKLSDGSQFPLKGHIDLLHERYVLQWDELADVDTIILGRNMSSYGIMLLANIDKYLKSCGASGLPEDVLKKVQMGYSNLQLIGVKKYDFGNRPSNYELFHQVKAPLEVLKDPVYEPLKITIK